MRKKRGGSGAARTRTALIGLILSIYVFPAIANEELQAKGCMGHVHAGAAADGSRAAIYCSVEPLQLQASWSRTRVAAGPEELRRRHADRYQVQGRERAGRANPTRSTTLGTASWLAARQKCKQSNGGGAVDQQGGVRQEAPSPHHSRTVPRPHTRSSDDFRKVRYHLLGRVVPAERMDADACLEEGGLQPSRVG